MTFLRISKNHKWIASFVVVFFVFICENYVKWKNPHSMLFYTTRVFFQIHALKTNSMLFSIFVILTIVIPWFGMSRNLKYECMKWYALAWSTIQCTTWCINASHFCCRHFYFPRNTKNNSRSEYEKADTRKNVLWILNGTWFELCVRARTLSGHQVIETNDAKLFEMQQKPHRSAPKECVL